MSALNPRQLNFEQLLDSLAQPQAHRRRTGGIGFLHMHPLPFLHPFCISVTQTRAFGNKQTPSASGGGSFLCLSKRTFDELLQ